MDSNYPLMDSDFLFTVSDYPFMDSGFVLFPFSGVQLSTFVTTAVSARFATVIVSRAVDSFLLHS
jgi:hypothetical protein